MLSTSEFLQQCRDMERAIGGKVSWPSMLAVGGSLAAGLGYFNDSRLTSAKELFQKDIGSIHKDIELKHEELKRGLEKLTEQVEELNNSRQPTKKWYSTSS